MVSRHRMRRMHSSYRSFDRSQGAIYPIESGPSPDSIPEPKERGSNSGNLMIFALIGYISGILLILAWYVIDFGRERKELSLKWLCIVLLGLLFLIVIYNRATKYVRLDVNVCKLC